MNINQRLFLIKDFYLLCLARVLWITLYLMNFDGVQQNETEATF